ncbi:MAG: MFS transporter [Rhodoplanes sp.]|uniref:MFS transporter n=1 Tax=Rhodoplanes sp. TaxID=1968906 RepID=UPI0017A903F2|nr:MFS transporter [Rhodoplanes sp.]NVO17906.1 MFS transporter [Rhodoplanes sp.]
MGEASPPEPRDGSAAAATPPDTTRVLAIAALSLFATSLFMRSVDPVIPQIAASFDMDVRTVALLSTAYALPYALAQPFLGSLGDTLGKTLVLKVCLALSAVAGFLGAFAPDYTVLLVSRVLVGMVSGGIFPIALAIGGDLVPVHRRQVAFGRLLAAAMLGNVLGSPLAGVIADTVGWRGVFALVAGLAVVAFVATMVGLRGPGLDRRTRFEMATVVGGYRAIFKNPLAKICFSAVFLEGAFLYGIFPFIAVLLAARGEGRAAIAGVVIAGFAVGGFLYSGFISVLLGRLGERGMMIGGGLLMAGGLSTVALGLAWPFEFAAFTVLGLGFYSLHGVIQVYVTELAPAARGTAMALHGCAFFVGQALGPVFYRYGFDHLGVGVTGAIGAVALLGVGLMCAAKLRRPENPDRMPAPGA